MSKKTKEDDVADAGRRMLSFLEPESPTISPETWAKMTPDQRRYELEKAVGMHPEKDGIAS